MVGQTLKTVQMLANSSGIQAFFSLGLFLIPTFNNKQKTKSFTGI